MTAIRTLTAVTVVTMVLLAAWPVPAQQPGAGPTAPGAPAASLSGSGGGPDTALYLQLNNVGLDPGAVYHIRDAGLDREDIHISLDDGTIAFTHAVDGRITGAMFEGDGEVLLMPPDQAERSSLSLFTGAAVLEEKFTSAYFRFNDDTAAELKPWLRPTDEGADFITRWDATARDLAHGESLRLLISFLNASAHPPGSPPSPPPGDRLLRVRFQGAHLGIFDLYFDTLLGEQIVMAKFSYVPEGTFYDVMSSFPMRSARSAQSPPPQPQDPILRYKIRATVKPPDALEADTELDVNVTRAGERVLLFELSRFLKVSQVEADGKPVGFLQNEALEGTALARRGNDTVAVVFPQPLSAGVLHLRFTYAGSVMASAGGGLFYVGARGAWYPNRGMLMSDYDLEFHYPAKLTLLATGKQVSHKVEGEEQVARWVSERPIPIAGFNLGEYSRQSAKAGGVEVNAYAAVGMETNFPQPPPVIVAQPRVGRRHELPPIVSQAPALIPGRSAQAVADTAARALNFFSQHFGPYPYAALALTQMPGHLSQGWPGLIFLSSYAFLSPDERTELRFSPTDSILYDSFMEAHETAHQWWGDLLIWNSYRDQWLVEALSNYSAILALEKERPDDCKALLEHYRQDLVGKNKAGEEEASAGPVTLGLRLSSSHFPDGFAAISYGRGTWLMHMLRTMLRDAAQLSSPPPRGARGADAPAPQEEPFVRALRKLRDRYQGKPVSTREFLDVVAEEMPDSLKYDGKKSLDWFYNDWVNGTALPRLELANVRLTNRGTSTVATGTIRQKEAPEDFVTSVPVYASTTPGKDLVLVGRVFADGEESNFRLTVPADTRKLVLDPYGTVLTRP